MSIALSWVPWISPVNYPTWGNHGTPEFKNSDGQTYGWPGDPWACEWQLKQGQSRWGLYPYLAGSALILHDEHQNCIGTRACEVPVIDWPHWSCLCRRASLFPFLWWPQNPSSLLATLHYTSGHITETKLSTFFQDFSLGAGECEMWVSITWTESVWDLERQCLINP